MITRAAPGEGPESRLRTRRRTRLTQQIRHVDGDRAHGDAENSRYLLVRHALGQQAQHFALAGGQVVGGRGRAWRSTERVALDGDQLAEPVGVAAGAPPDGV